MTLKASNIFSAIIVLVACTERLVFWGVLFGFDLRFWHILLSITGCLLLMKNWITIPKYATHLAVLLLIHSTAVFAFTGQLGLFTVIQFIIFLTSIVIAYSLVKHLGLEKCIGAFQLSALVLSFFIVAENVLHMMSGILIYPTELVGPFVKARGVLTEPSQAALWISPAILTTLIQKKKLSTFILMLGVVLSFSSLAIIATIVAILLYAAHTLMVKNKEVSSAKIFFLLSIFVALAFSQSAFQSRLDGAILSMDVISSDSNEIKHYKELGGSVATLALNSRVAIEGLLDTYGLGVGFGNFRYAFDRYAPEIITTIREIEDTFYNRSSGGNLLIRSLAELGVFGPLIILFFVIYLYKHYSKSSQLLTHDKRYAVNSAALGMAIVGLVVFTIRKDMWFSFNLSSIIAVASLALCHRTFSQKYFST